MRTCVLGIGNELREDEGVENDIQSPLHKAVR
jgi:Ni,Fe-hydrogenase maturation factor